MVCNYCWFIIDFRLDNLLSETQTIFFPLASLAGRIAPGGSSVRTGMLIFGIVS